MKNTPRGIIPTYHQMEKYGLSVALEKNITNSLLIASLKFNIK